MLVTKQLGPYFFLTMETIRKVTTSDLEVRGCIMKHFILPLSSPKWQSKFFVKSFLSQSTAETNFHR